MTILVKKLKFKTIIGILKFERKKKQKIRVDAKFKADEFIDYAEICKILKAEFRKNKFLKIEDGLEYFETYFKEKFKTLKFFKMKIVKMEILKNVKVGVSTKKFY